MSDRFLIKVFEHNNWANLQIIDVCSKLSDEQLDASPSSITKGSIRQTLIHLVRAQSGYLSLLTLQVEDRSDISLTFEGLQENAHQSGKGLLALARGDQEPISAQIETTDGYRVSPWVVMVQVINHATEHREQIKSMLTAQGILPPTIDGWTFGEVTGELVKLPE